MAKKVILILFIVAYCCMLVFFLPVQVKVNGNLVEQKYVNITQLQEEFYSTAFNGKMRRFFMVEPTRLIVNSFIFTTPFAIAFILAGRKKRT